MSSEDNQNPLLGIVSPPLSITEEDDARQAPNESSRKGKGLHQTELFETQRLMNGVKPNPSRVNQYAQSWRYYLSNYSERRDCGRVFVKVDGRLSAAGKCTTYTHVQRHVATFFNVYYK